MEHNCCGFSHLTKWLELNNINIIINISAEPKAVGARVPNLGHVRAENLFRDKRRLFKEVQLAEQNLVH